MSTSEIKIELFRLIDKLDEDSLIKFYNYFIKNKTKKNTDFWNELSETQQEDINKGLDDLNKGKKKDFSQVIQKH
jgi:hypothetical protein